MHDQQAGTSSGSRELRSRMAVSELNVVHQSAPYRTPELRNTLPINIPQLSLCKKSDRLCPGQITTQKSHDSVFYLGYGSNLAAATFLGARGIRPLSKVNVVVPTLRLTFDLAGFPYNEPCFANSAKRDIEQETELTTSSSTCDDTPLLHSSQQPLRWNKGLVGVLYEVTPSDYAHIIATEGGGSSYEDIIVDCYPLSNDPTLPVPTDFTGQTPLKGHTLFAPAEPPSSPPQITRTSRITRPNPDYAQPSPRYLGLITSGALENSLPNEYQTYLDSLHAYTITSRRQKMAQYIFTMTWAPIIFGMMKLASTIGDGNGTGKWPKWATKLAQVIFAGVWWSYDNFWKDRFGDGERTEGDDYEDEHVGVEINEGMDEKGGTTGHGRVRTVSGYGSFGTEKYENEKMGWAMV